MYLINVRKANERIDVQLNVINTAGGCVAPSQRPTPVLYPELGIFSFVDRGVPPTIKKQVIKSFFFNALTLFS